MRCAAVGIPPPPPRPQPYVRVADTAELTGTMDERVTLAALQQMKREQRKIVAVVVYDCQMARIADRAGVDIVSAGDSVGINLWGHRSEAEVTFDQMLIICQA